MFFFDLILRNIFDVCKHTYYIRRQKNSDNKMRGVVKFFFVFLLFTQMNGTDIKMYLICVLKIFDCQEDVVNMSSPINETVLFSPDINSCSFFFLCFFYHLEASCLLSSKLSKVGKRTTISVCTMLKSIHLHF